MFAALGDLWRTCSICPAGRVLLAKEASQASRASEASQAMDMQCRKDCAGQISKLDTSGESPRDLLIVKLVVQKTFQTVFAKATILHRSHFGSR